MCVVGGGADYTGGCLHFSLKCFFLANNPGLTFFESLNLSS